jgi:4-aminobutyrate aminotransferase / (S)-3-amino-2-methylpropionate transaminase / 5-aminovalerate transaminase
LACEAALAVLALYDEQRLGDRARMIGEQFVDVTRDWSRRFPVIGELRGLGAMRAIELVRDRATREPAREETARLIRLCHERGLIILSAGTFGNVVRLLMPLIATPAQVGEGLAVIEGAFADVCGEVVAQAFRPARTAAGRPEGVGQA